MLSKVVEHLLIGDAKWATTCEESIEMTASYQIKKILTISFEPIDKKLRIKNIEYEFLYMLDIETQNIFSVLGKAINLIEESLQTGNTILVHCESGISRSSTIAIAYLMRRFKWNLQAALQFLKEKHPIACPNASFVHQLGLFERVEYATDPALMKHSPYFRDFIASNQQLFASDRDPTATYNLNESRELSYYRKYSCRRCRKELFFDFNVLRHYALEASSSPSHCEFKYLLTPMEWMQLDEYKGKINCPGCHSKIGNFVWDGRHCNYKSIEYDFSRTCGKFVQPWIQIQSDKIDAFDLNRQKVNLTRTLKDISTAQKPFCL